MSEPQANPSRTAVVVVHGMGEQWPMETLWSFVQSVWTGEDLVNPRYAQVYPKPDAITGSFELRRITTAGSALPDRRRFDFFEFYWAHLMQGNTMVAIAGWVWRLVARRLRNVPRRLRPLWGLCVGLSVLLVGLVAGSQVPKAWWPATVPRWIVGTIAAIPSFLGLVAAAVVVPVLGDAARYLSPSPKNVGARQDIRDAGVELLERLHASGKYDRIIVVGHSLGTVVAYDVLHHAFSRVRSSRWLAAHDPLDAAGKERMRLLTALENAARALVGDGPPGDREGYAPADGAARAEYRDAQRAYANALCTYRDDEGPLWLVTDFVTTGSPLSKADVLLARPRVRADSRLRPFEALVEQHQDRELPRCPPQFEKLDPPRFSYPLRAMHRRPHHAAVFGPVTWTNLHFHTRWLLWGDLIAGPVAPQMGEGVLDVELPYQGFGRFVHTRYWGGGPLNDARLVRLREHVGLARTSGPSVDDDEEEPTRA